MKKIIKDKAFTLAEVLITLTIIGVIAALTIPNLMQKNREQEMVSRLKKSYTTFSNAFEFAVRENGPIEDWDIAPKETSAGAEKLFNYIRPYLKIKTYCGKEKGCLASSYKTLSGGVPWDNIENNNKNYSKFLMEDGSSAFLWVYKEDCGGGSSVCGTLAVDVNGKKLPNQWGVDTFEFHILRDKLVPSTGEYAKRCKYKGTDDQNGKTCTKWVIIKGNMDYLKRDISTEL